MTRPSASTLNPTSLPPDTVLGPWRVVDWAGHGVHSTVYRAVQVDKEQGAPVALKLALHPAHPRFNREVELLSRLRHPHIPRLWDSGQWVHPSGAVYPYLVTEWVEGTTLYAAAEHQPPSTQQVLVWLGQLARALQAVHALGAVHRDVKGANVLVRLSDRLVFLADFGSGLYPGASTLTPAGLVMCTPAYRAPEAALFELRSLREPSARHDSRPAEDLYALGVTACRLVTGEYPEFSDPWKDAQGVWHLDSVRTPDALLQVDPLLRSVIQRLLSIRPEERGTAAELAEELERATQPQAPAPSSGAPAAVSSAAAPASARMRLRHWPRWLGTTAAALVLATCAWQAVFGLLGLAASILENERAEVSQPDAGTAGLGDAMASAVPRDSSVPSAPEQLAEETPPEPLPGQTRPDSKGRCPRKHQVAINGGCWVELVHDKDKCEALNLHLYKGSCYVPVIPPGRPPTSTPTHAQPASSQ